MLDLTTTLAGNVITTCFFGSDLKSEKIEGKTIPCFIKELIGHMAIQLFGPLGVLGGYQLVELGLRQKDREVNRRIALYKKWGEHTICQRVEEIKKKHSNGELSDNPADLIEAIVRESLKNEKG